MYKKYIQSKKSEQCSFEFILSTNCKIIVINNEKDSWQLLSYTSKPFYHKPVKHIWDR